MRRAGNAWGIDEAGQGQAPGCAYRGASQFFAQGLPRGRDGDTVVRACGCVAGSLEQLGHGQTLGVWLARAGIELDPFDAAAGSHPSVALQDGAGHLEVAVSHGRGQEELVHGRPVAALASRPRGFDPETRADGSPMLPTRRSVCATRARTEHHCFSGPPAASSKRPSVEQRVLQMMERAKLGAGDIQRGYKEPNEVAVDGLPPPRSG